jgi:ferrous iron transport protein A
MMPLTLADMGTAYTIKRVGGTQEVKKHLEDMGFVVGGDVTVVNILGGNVIANVKDTRVGISRELAQKIMV